MLRPFRNHPNSHPRGSERRPSASSDAGSGAGSDIHRLPGVWSNLTTAASSEGKWTDAAANYTPSMAEGASSAGTFLADRHHSKEMCRSDLDQSQSRNHSAAPTAAGHPRNDILAEVGAWVSQQMQSDRDPSLHITSGITGTAPDPRRSIVDECGAAVRELNTYRVRDSAPFTSFRASPLAHSLNSDTRSRVAGVHTTSAVHIHMDLKYHPNGDRKR